MTTTAFKTTALVVANTDSYSWINPAGGFWGIASSWQDTTLGAVATSPPGAASTVSVTGGIGDAFTNINGTGAAAQLSIVQDVLFWGSVTVSGTLALVAPQSGTTELDLDGGASVTAASLTLAAGSTLEVTTNSTLQTTGTATLTDGFLLAANHGSVQLGSLIANGTVSSRGAVYGTIAVDDTSAIEIGNTGGAALGAITIDAGQSAAIAGTLDGNLILNGTLAVQAGASLAIDVNDPFGNATSISGSGTLVITQNSQVTLGVVDSAAIRFNAPTGTLVLNALPTGTISGFTVGDIIQLRAGLATGLSYTQTNANTGTLTLTKGGVVVGTLTLAGSYTASQFHLRLDSAANGFISLQNIGTVAAQPTLLTGTAGSDSLIATANGQTLTGYGGSDTLSGGVFTGIVFKDTSANLSGSTLAAFVASDVIDLTDMRSASVTFTYVPPVFSSTATPVPGTLIVSDGTRSATVTLSIATVLPAGSWSATTDGASGTFVKYTTLNTDAYAFNSALGGAYSQTSNWQDTTTGSAAAQAPGSGNAVTISGGAITYADITGSGVAGSMTTSGDVLLLGTINVGATASGITGALTQAGTLALDSAANLILAGSVAIGGLLELGGASKLTAAGTLSFTSPSASLLALNGSAMRFGGVITNSTTAYPPAIIGVDANSSIEIGTTGTARIGALTIDAGITASFGGAIEGNVIVNGTLAVSGRSLSLGSFGPATATVSGTGILEIDSGGILSLAGPDSTAIQFGSGSTGTLALGSILPTGTITGFTKSDVITLARPVTTLRYSQSGSTGTLSLFNGTATVGTLTLAGTYTAQLFQVQLSPGGTSSTITYAATPSTTTGTQISTGTDSYTWTNTSGGVWNNAGNWTDTTTNKAATTAPGAADPVVIQDNPGTSTYQIISGSGAAASLSIYAPASTVFTGSVAVAGQFWIAPGNVILKSGASFSVGQLYDYGNLQIGGSTLTVTQAASTAEVVGTFSVVDGSTATIAAALDMAGGTIDVDSTSTLEFGTIGGAASGAMTIDAGQIAHQEEFATIAANLVVNGTLIVANGTIQGFGGTAGSITGSGTIQIGATTGAGRLILRAPDTAALLFYHPGSGGYDTLELQGPIPSGTISGFSLGDTIQVDQTVTGVYFSQANANQGSLFLTNGPTTVGILNIVGNYTNYRFQVDVAAATGIATIYLLPTSSSSSSAAADTSFDAYNWIGGGSGNWGTAANWRDTTTGTTPGTVPGSNSNPVTIAGTTTIGGNGSAGNLTITGNTIFTGQVTVSWTLAVGAASGQAASVEVTGGGRLITAIANITGRWQIGNGSIGVVYYFATLSGGTLLSLAGSTVQLGGLLTTGTGNVIAIDSYSIIKIGAPASTPLGALSLAPGTTTAIAGSIYGNVVANGMLQVASGNTLLIDMTGMAVSDPYSNTPTVTGSAGLWLTEGSTLGLGAATSAPIQMVGPNITLLLATLPTGTITGFGASDRIQLAMTVTGVSFQQTTGVLTLTNGATTVGTLKFAGSYTGTAFHVDTAPNGATATITLQTLGLAAAQPTLIQGSATADTLTATANGQTITGNGGNDTMDPAGFTGIVFKDITAYMNSYTVTNFAPSDWLDFTDLNPATAWVRYSGGIVTVYDGAHAANMHVAFATTPATGSFSITSDGASGSKVSWS